MKMTDREQKKNREVFYVSTNIWKQEVGLFELAVYVYLCYCSNIRGESFPSMAAIARNCHMSHRRAQSAVAMLEKRGIIERVQRRESKRNSLPNLYRLRTGVFSGKRTPKHFKEQELPALAGDEAVFAKAPGPDHEEPDPELDELLESIAPLDPDDHDPMLEAIYLAVARMWRAPSIKVGGTEIPGSEVRKRLKLLDCDSIHSIMLAMRERKVVNRSAYLVSCIFNAPLETLAYAGADSR